MDGPIARTPEDEALMRRDMLLHGLGILRDGSHVPLEDFYLEPPPVPEGYVRASDLWPLVPGK